MLRAALALLLLVAACGGDAAPAASSTTSGATITSMADSTTTTAPPATTTTTAGLAFEGDGNEYPPAEFEALAAFFDPLVAPLGYKMGRAVLIDRATYTETPDGNHLALYLEPLSARTPDEYAAEFLPIAIIFMPAVFAAWPGLDSFDVCQEPFDWEGETAPPGLTVFDIDRESAATIDWATVDLAGLLAADEALTGLSIHAAAAIRDSATWSAALDG